MHYCSYLGRPLVVFRKSEMIQNFIRGFLRANTKLPPKLQFNTLWLLRAKNPTFWVFLLPLLWLQVFVVVIVLGTSAVFSLLDISLNSSDMLEELLLKHNTTSKNKREKLFSTRKILWNFWPFQGLNIRPGKFRFKRLFTFLKTKFR